MRDEQGFADFAAVRGGALRRQALLLAGTPDRARELTERALADTARRWDRLGGPAAAEEHARRVLATGAARRRPGGPVPPAAEGRTDAEVVWRALAGLPARRRVVLVLRHDEGLADAAVAARLGVPVATVAAEAEAGLGALRSVLRRRGRPEDLLPATLADPPDLPPPDPPPAPGPAGSPPGPGSTG